ncbi:MAG: hypothetical protein HQL36_09155 [Alphaproteobacteria bacterium]|nr:hypothetical protein [Alphaproteobacteria bacterium]
MCNALSPEKAVIWSVLHGLEPAGPLSADHFTLPAYRVWFACAQALRDGGEAVREDTMIRALRDAGHHPGRAELRSLKRLLGNPPPPRIRGNAGLLAQALLDRHAGRRMHIERLIN